MSYFHQGAPFHQKASVVAVAGYSIETPTLLLNSACDRFPEGVGNDFDLVGRYLMVQGGSSDGRAVPGGDPPVQSPPADEHEGVVEINLRSFAVPNIFITDGSVMPTQGSAIEDPAGAKEGYRR